MEQDLTISDRIIIPGNEISWRFSRSGGPGGQNVNKVESRVTIIFNPEKSDIFSEVEKALIRKRLKGSMDSDGNLFIDVSQERSQLRNRKIARERLAEKLMMALRPVSRRKPTRISRSQKEKRLKKKRLRSQTKNRRRLDRRNLDDSI